MKNRTIRVLALVMAMLMIVPMLVGCNGDGDKKSEEGRKAEPLEGEVIKDLCK